MEIFLRNFKFIAKDIVGNVIYFPLWWYSVGAIKILQKIWQDAKDFVHNLNLDILFKYLFKPMYGQTDIWGRIISFIVRIGHFSVLAVITFFWILILFIFFLFWLALPVIVAFNIMLQLGIVKI